MPKRSSDQSFRAKSSIKFVDQDDPPFLKKIKDRVGYVKAPTVDDKFVETTSSGYIENDVEEDDLLNVREEDRPQIVVLDATKDLAKECLDDELEKRRMQNDRKLIEERKIKFEKPYKRKLDDDCSEMIAEKESSQRNAPSKPAHSNSRLLSFGDDEED